MVASHVPVAFGHVNRRQRAYCVRTDSAMMLLRTSNPFRTSRLGMRASQPFRARMTLALLHLLWIPFLFPVPLASQRAKQQTPFGVAWRVIGPWRIEGKQETITKGTSVTPGSLLRPVAGAKDHSITILLPDGQRVLYECFASRDCARGFRVPSLYRNPSSTAVDLLARVNAVSQRRTSDSHALGEPPDETAEPRDEAVALISPDNKVIVAGLAAALSDGTYSYIVEPLTHSPEKQVREFFEKHGRTITLSVPSEGLFKIAIYDRLNTRRVDFMLAAVRKGSGAKILSSFHDVEMLLKDWNEDYQGWPIHDFRRDFLRSMVLGIEPYPLRSSQPASSIERARAANATCEPRFSPSPGVFKKDTEVKLQCSTPGAILRYTVDGSQPLDAATIYRAPIIVKGTALTIKAFASSEGREDSPVVTGIFRIGD